MFFIVKKLKYKFVNITKFSVYSYGKEPLIIIILEIY